MSGFQAAAVSGSVMILVIALLRLTAGKRLPRALFPALWCAAAFRLLLPVRLPLPVLLLELLFLELLPVLLLLFLLQ